MNIRTLHRRYPYILTWLVFIVIALLTLRPSPVDEEPIFLFPHFDKFVHFMMFGAAAAVWWMEWSMKHRRQQVSLPDFGRIFLMVAVIGGVDELLQELLTADRSAEWLDFLADLSGALLLPLLCRPILNGLLRNDGVHLVGIPSAAEIAPQLRQVYIDSFPESERRDWNDILTKASQPEHPLKFTEIRVASTTVGFITWWAFVGFRYVEHFVIDPRYRGVRLGEQAIKAFVDDEPSPVVLEVEPADSSAMAARRIAFYKRCGFVAHPEYKYIQPPYAPHLPSVELMLMTAKRFPTPLYDVDSTLKFNVYNVK